MSFTDIRVCASATRRFASATRLAMSSVAAADEVGVGATMDEEVAAVGGASIVAEKRDGFLPVMAAILAAISALFCLMSSSAES